MNGNGTGKYTVWHYVGCGCAVLGAIGLILVGSCFYFGYRTATDMRDSIADPEIREAKVRELLGYDDLPEGYVPGFAFSVPFVMDMAAVGDRELGSGERMSVETDDVFDERGFLYFRMRRFGNIDDVEGETDYDFDADEELSRGEIDAAGARVRYTAQRGTSYAGGQPIPSLATEMEFDCGDSFHRFGVWFVRIGADDDGAETEVEAVDGETEAEADAELEVAEDAEPVEPVEAIEATEEPEIDLTGTPADEEALRAFLDHFDVCRS
jgi:hypothetical protein